MQTAHNRLGEIDLVSRFAHILPAWAIQLCFGLICVAGAILARLIVDLFAPTAGPYSLIYPAILISTLFGRWQAGLITFAGSFAYAWYVVLPDTWSFAFAVASDAPRTAVNGAAALIILLFAEIFRRAVRRASHERDQELALTTMLMRELHHRTENNFNMVLSLLDLQRSQQITDDARDALSIAAARVESFATLHRSLHHSAGNDDQISMRDYLSDLSTMLSSALFADDRVTIEFHADEKLMPRRRAVAIGLVLNEIVTNAARHAFTDGRPGKIDISFKHDPNEPWCLTITDNGIGLPSGNGTQPPAGSGLGSQLVDVFASRAGGEVFAQKIETGTRISLIETGGRPAPA